LALFSLLCLASVIATKQAPRNDGNKILKIGTLIAR